MKLRFLKSKEPRRKFAPYKFLDRRNYSVYLVCGPSGCKKCFGRNVAFFEAYDFQNTSVEYRFSNEPKILNDSWFIDIRKKRKKK